MSNRMIDVSFWDDEYITELDPSEKLMYLYFLTNPLTNIAGIYKITTRRICFDTGFNETTVKHILSKFEKSGKVYKCGEYLIMKSFPKYQKWEKMPKIREGIFNILMELPEEILIFLADINYTFDLEPVLEARDLYSDDILAGEIEKLANEKVETEEKIEVEPKKKAIKKFVKPTTEEIKNYCTENDYNVNADKFYLYYESNGWKVGKLPMKDWKACVRRWELNEKKFNQNKKPVISSDRDPEKLKNYKLETNCKTFYDGSEVGF